MTTKTVIFGGYGAVGREAAAELVASGMSVVLAGRHPEKARPVPGAEMIQVDVSDATQVARALEGADAVLMCAELDNARLARACFERAVHYLDVTASHSVISPIEELHDVAVAHGAVGVLSVGLMPGVTNLLARYVVELSSEKELRLGVVLGSGEAHGPAALRWTLDGLGRLHGSWTMRFPEGNRKVRHFPVSDQYTLPRTLGLERAVTGIALDSKLMTMLLAPGLARLMRSRPMEALMSRVHLGSDRFAVKAESGTAGAWFTGNRQSRATGLVAALLIKRLGDLPAGVGHIEQLVDPAEFLTELAGHGFQLHLPERKARR